MGRRMAKKCKPTQTEAMLALDRVAVNPGCFQACGRERRGSVMLTEADNEWETGEAWPRWIFCVFS